MSDHGGQQPKRNGFWNSTRLKKLGITVIVPFEPERIECNTYELRVAGEYFETSMEGGKDTVPNDKQMIIPPGQLALLITQEEVILPPTTMGFISIKFKEKFRGLINVSGFHVDPGFKGRLKFSVYNAGSEKAVLDPGQPLFAIWFVDLMDEESNPYHGDHQNQMHITAEDVRKVQGDIASPGQLKTEINELRKDFDGKLAEVDKKQHLHAWVLTVLTALFFAVILVPMLKGCGEDTSSRDKAAAMYERRESHGEIDINFKVQGEGFAENAQKPGGKPLRVDQDIPEPQAADREDGAGSEERGQGGSHRNGSDE